MKALRKSTLALLTLTFSLSLTLAGCSKSTTETTASATPAPATSTAPAATKAATSDLKPYEVKLVYPGTPQPDQAKVEDAMNKVLKDKINATIKLMPIDWGQWDNKTNLMIASREEFDILFTAQWNGHAVNVGKGALMPLNDLLGQYGKGITDSLDPAFLEGAKINGKNYGVPTNKELAASGGVVYRSDIAKELGIDMTAVKTMADLGNVLKVVKEKKPEMTAFFLRDGDNLNAHYLAQYDYLGDSTIPGVIMKDGTDTKVIPKWDQPRYKEILKLTRDFMQKGYVNKDAATTQLSGQDALKSGNVFMITSSLKPGKDSELANAVNLVGKLAQIELTPRTISTGDTAGSMLGISVTSKDPARAMMVINLLHTDKQLNNLINFGIEGVHYTKVSENIIKATDAGKNYAPGAAWQFGNQFLNYLYDNEDPQKWDKFKEFNKSGKKSPGLGFTFDSEPVKTQVAAAVNVGKEFDAAMDTGSVDMDASLPKYQDKMKAAGIDKIIAEKQKQLDAFLAAAKK
ncbi:ABC transporter substrate-binding protein [Paenibacillus pectinilyticus]|uniref:ABC transporter substrate-binding protein n=1 Tax=Paenibacillus pectinilyticus TaxID=512399 RepID=A0A1C1A851_9BACL|nr:ABC transporter substrate-binding protein [Paenibacillus pectinilyticus]OCT16758.1 ABC transporter substrate-binding protein [Paenibacillus pectinilyticus]